ncbi:hypothetical protein BaRGS_00016846 [Batillaria attramentaria]|uniref:Uncharacterized protein n=1 Tax=Batillaria attramentaria TaxID=370345 RepID=A0ABD0KXK2_9CAEN
MAARNQEKSQCKTLSPSIGRPKGDDKLQLGQIAATQSAKSEYSYTRQSAAKSVSVALERMFCGYDVLGGQAVQLNFSLSKFS